MLKVFITIVGVVLLGLGIKGLLGGSVVEGGKGNTDKTSVERDQEPFNFWATCLFYIGFGGWLVYNGLTSLVG